MVFTPLLAWFVVSNSAFAATHHAREIRLAEHAIAAAPNAQPSAAHPEGTVIVSSGAITAEVDVALGSVIGQFPWACPVLKRIDARVVGVCEGDIVAFDVSFAIAWRAHWARNAALAPKDVFSNGGDVVVAAFSDAASLLVLRVADAAGSPISEVCTSASLGDARGQVHVRFDGRSIRAYAWHHAISGKLVTLSTDRRTVVAERPLSNAELPSDGAARLATTDIDGLGGSGVNAEFDLAANHFWLTFGCCGDQGGLFVAKMR